MNIRWIIILMNVFCIAGTIHVKSQNPRRICNMRLSAESRKYIDPVRIFAENALHSGKDNYGPLHTPLFIDGMNVHTGEPVKWKFPGGTEWVLSDLGNQQNFFRTLDGLSNLTGDDKYRNAAIDALKYAFEHLRFGGLLAWGGHMAYNATADSVVFAPDKAKVHELKSHYPYYELMWKADPGRTRELIENIWNSHVLNWGNLDFNRHGVPRKLGILWDNDYSDGSVFFWGQGLTFLNAGSDLYYAAAELSFLSGDEKPLIWAKRLAYRYVETRNSKTGLGGYQFSQTKAWCDEFGKILGDRAIYQYGDDFPGHFVVEGTLFPCYGNIPSVTPEICNFSIARLLGEKGKEFRQWAVENLKAWARSSYRKSDHSFVPMLTDGTSMEGYVCKKEGYFGPKGRVLTAGKTDAGIFRVYARAIEISDDSILWFMARDAAMVNNLGDIGLSPGHKLHLNYRTQCSDSRALYGFLSLYKKTKTRQYLRLAQKIGDNIIRDHFNKGYFTRGRNMLYARFDDVDPLALLSLAAVMEGRENEVPDYPGGNGFFASAYDTLGHKYDNQFIYNIPASE